MFLKSQVKVLTLIRGKEMKRTADVRKPTSIPESKLLCEKGNGFKSLQAEMQDIDQKHLAVNIATHIAT